MTTTTITKARGDLFKIADRVITFNDVVNITTKDGNVIMMSEQDYNNLTETLYLHSLNGVVESILDEADTPIEEFRVFDWKKELGDVSDTTD